MSTFVAPGPCAKSGFEVARSTRLARPPGTCGKHPENRCAILRATQGRSGIGLFAGPFRGAQSAWMACFFWLLLAAAHAHAAARAKVQPERISLGNTATLTIETDEINVQPDLSALEKDFAIGGQSSSMQTSFVNGQRSTRTTYMVEIEPKAEGVLTVPAIRIGSAQTEPLVLTVTPVQQGSAAGGDPLFMETELSTTTPYVQQAVTYTVRLFFAMQLASGDINASAPPNASLQQLGEDKQWQQEINGRRYGVFERRYLLIPEQSGPMELPAARFRGAAQVGGGGGFFGRTQNVSAAGKVYSLDVRPQPATAPQPWLAARSVALVRGDLPASARAGEPVLVELTLTADGVLASQLSDLEWPPMANAQVFPEPAQKQDSIVDGQPVATLKRRFAIVPSREGSLELPEVRVGYWNVASDRADAAVIPASELDVAPGATLMAPVPVAPSLPVSAPVPLAPTAAPGANARPWQWATAILSLALTLALVWGWRRGQRRPAAGVPQAKSAQVDPAALRSALAKGDLCDIGDALRRSCDPPALNLGEVRARLDDPEQRAALDALQRLRWSGASTEAHADVRARLRAAFKSGPKLRKGSERGEGSVLPPLYPVR